MDDPCHSNNVAIWKNKKQFFWKWKEIDDASLVQRWQAAMSIMMGIHYLRTPWLPVTCPFFHPPFFLNDSIHISVTVIRLCLLLRKWKSSIWPLYLTSGWDLCCAGLQIDGAVAPFHATILSLSFFFHNSSAFVSRPNSFNVCFP